MVDESTPEALKTAAENVGQDIKKDTPGIIEHLENFLAWDKKEMQKALTWIKSKL